MVSSGVYALLALTLSAGCLSAASIPVVNISINADIPNTGGQEIQIVNETGLTNGCGAYYQVCDQLNIVDWALTVHYTSSYYNSPGNPILPSPFTSTWSSSADNIGTSPLAFDFDLCSGVSALSCGTPTTTITEIDFSGQLDQSSFTIYDPNANSGAGGPGPTFFSNPSFSVVLTPTGSFPADFVESTDGSVSDQISVTPEPSSTLLLLSGFLALNWRRRR